MSLASSANVKTPPRSAFEGWLVKTTNEASQPEVKTVSACRNRNQSPDASSAPLFSWVPLPLSLVTNLAPISKATCSVSSVDPASTTIISISFYMFLIISKGEYI